MPASAGRAPRAAPGKAARAAPSPFPRALAARLAKLGIRSRFDLVLHLPLRYEDETELTSAERAPPGVPVLVEAEVERTEVVFRPRRQLIVHARADGIPLVLRFFSFYPSQAAQFKRAIEGAGEEGLRVRAFREVKSGWFGAEMLHPRCRFVRAGDPLPAALTPIYPTTAGLAQPVLRKMVLGALDAEPMADTLPEALRRRYTLEGFAEAVRLLHRPPPQADASALAGRTHPAWTRVKFDELMAQQLSMRLHYLARRERAAPVLAGQGPLQKRLLAALPFRLTGAQRRCLAEILADLAQAHPMQRLLQGDVGSGKTVLAALAALAAADAGWQAAVMAPTEILAEQHYRKFSEWLAPLGLSIAWLHGGLPRKERRTALAAVASGEARIAIGTHALFQDEVEFARLGLAVVDEQHRFGVQQRLALRQKAAGAVPHQLMMSATPIPRTLSMSYYADLDVSVIDELPPGRTPVKTRLVSNARRDEVLGRIRDACSGGQQAYWVCPLIEESETLDLQTALDAHAELQAALPGVAVGLLHGRLPTAEKAAVMAAFKDNRIGLLVATTVIEVGVDVPNASLMVIEHAERIGLSQLHQLRGRVGRGSRESVCILLYANPLSQTARARLKVIYEHSDGFEVARADLHIRGPGEYLGERQSGAPLLRFADLERDAPLIPAAREAAERLLADDRPAALAHVERWLGGRQDFARV
ncbi:MAG: ATP-dependent DNA helicase RecG [Betaproteobacteria bacterium]|nr:ATP-dependent DNA helicase RecG [Betaproteobacteria bacterium]